MFSGIILAVLCARMFRRPPGLCNGDHCVATLCRARHTVILSQKGSFFWSSGKARRSLTAESSAVLLTFSEADVQTFFSRSQTTLRRIEELSTTMTVSAEVLRSKQAQYQTMIENKEKSKQFALGPLYHRRVRQAKLERKVGTQLS